MSERQELALDVFILGMATLERFFHKKLHQGDRDIYFEAVKAASQTKWEKVVQYACQRAKTSALPKPGELREWMGLGELLTPSEEAQGVMPGTLHGMTPADYVTAVRRGYDVPVTFVWEHPMQEACYLEAVINDPAPENLTQEQKLYWIRRYAEAADALYEKMYRRHQRPQPAETA